VTDDIKGLLDKAFGPEPPLTLDREEILRRGRRQVRIRRLTTSGGVAAAVVAVVLGAAALSNLPRGGETHSAAGPVSTTSPPPTPSDTAPQGPQLPLSTTAAPATQRAADLTRVLAEARVIPAGFEVRNQANGEPALRFLVLGDAFNTGAELADGNGSGRLLIQVSHTDQRVAPIICNARPPDTCSVVIEYGLRMSLATQHFDQGVVNYEVHTQKSDGTDIVAIASNSVTTSGPVMKATRAKPPLDFEVLKRIAALPRLTIG
jgi:hypothetical protein